MIVSKYNLRPGILILLCLFNCALLLHLGNSNWFYYKTTSLIVVMAGLQLLNYKMWWPTAVSIAACIAVFAVKVPRLANHFNLEIIIGFIILAFLLYRHMGFKTRITPHTLTLTMRCLLVTIYFIAGFHKLNSGFFSTGGSCASFINLIMFGQGTIMPPALTRTFQVATIVTEMMLPFGLLHYKLRRPTALLLVVFHIYLALCGFANFSAFAALMLFGAVANLSSPNVDVLVKNLKRYMLCCIGAALVALLYRYFPHHIKVLEIMRGIVFSIGFALLFKTLLYKMPVVKRVHGNYLIPVLAVAVLTLYSMQGYFGLGTARNLNMYSNLITEKSRNNHYLIDTGKTKIWDFEEDLVTIITLPKGAKLANGVPIEQYDLPMIEFRRNAKRWAASDPNASCTIVYRNERIYIPNLKKSSYSKTEWWHRFLFYRPVPKKGTNPCEW